MYTFHVLCVHHPLAPEASEVQSRYWAQEHLDAVVMKELPLACGPGVTLWPLLLCVALRNLLAWHSLPVHQNSSGQQHKVLRLHAFLPTHVFPGSAGG